MIKIKLVSVFLLLGCVLIGSVANAKTIEELQTEIKQKHGIRILKSSGDPGKSWHIGDVDFTAFLEVFLAEAEKQGLNEGDKKRFFPVKIKFRVYPENWNPFDQQVCYICSDVAFSENNIDVGHESASGVISFIIEHFPLEGTEEAAELELRNQAVRQAAMDKIRYIKGRGVDVQSCLFVDGLCDLDDESDIAYSTQEKLLQGLINLEEAIKNGDEDRSEVNIIPFMGIWSWTDSKKQLYDRWFVDDESKTENLILEYMEQLRIDSA